MKLETIRQRLILIGHYARVGAHQSALFHEYALHAAVLRAVANGEAGSREASEALRSFELQFPRTAA
jgi:hypothetical protein